MKSFSHSRRNFLKTSAAVTAGAAFSPYIISCRREPVPELMKRPFGKIDFEVTTFGLGGQASIQWVPPDLDPAGIIVKAFRKGVNYFDTSNLYGPSQSNYGRAFRAIDLVPGRVGYNEPMRKSIFLTSKTHLRWGKGGSPREGVGNRTNGVNPNHTLYDVKRSLSQVFGDGSGNYPEGAYLDMVLIHSLTNREEVDVLYEGIEETHPGMENIGALAVLRDVRDGTNRTGLNPKNEKLIRHIGFSGHYSAPVMMDMIRRDQYGILDGMLVAINSNDKLNMNMQNNVIQVARAKDMGVIGMKVFADGAMYTKEANWTNTSDQVVRMVGTSELPSRPLIQYALTTPGVHTAIIGIGHIDDDSLKCQLTQNIEAAQITPDGLSESDRLHVEEMTGKVKDGKTNYFQVDEGGLSAPDKAAVSQKTEDGQRVVELSWNSPVAGPEPIEKYEIWRDNEKIADIGFEPQTSWEPNSFIDKPGDKAAHNYTVSVVDKVGNIMKTEDLLVKSV
ncbi:MAG: aldo/keto reductase [Bacteroidales bacterium]|nr:aldo/keto reductase [Bacteroidales bacterium]